ncbi:carbohydrate ABC transporter permease [Rubellimicrobium arenae]|uniref:carbohydrate ABC transporter permease n=1 Tax=Rubellimicrobium arenae TaxID=2817372 RepID=UPI001B3006E5|nr:sugar ABC transporter permease [Rubellimicrobium arenae]
MTLQQTDTAAGPRPAARRRLSFRTREKIAGYLFVLPDALGLLVFVGLPMLLALGLGFFEVDGFGGYRFAGLANYRRMWADPLFWQSLGATLLYAAMLVPSLYVSGLGLALLVERTNAWNGVLRAIFFLPQMVSLVVVALIWKMLTVEKIGAISRALSPLGLGGISFLGNPDWAMFAVVFVSVWFLMGFYMLIFLGGLQDIPKEYYEAARIDGAGPLSSFWFITLPLLRPTSFFVLLVSLVTAVAGGAAFDLIYVMTKGGPANSTSLLIFYAYQQAFQYNSFGYAGAIASILVAVLLLVTLVMFLLTRGGRFQYE